MEIQLWKWNKCGECWMNWLNGCKVSSAGRNTGFSPLRLWLPGQIGWFFPGSLSHIWVSSVNTDCTFLLKMEYIKSAPVKTWYTVHSVQIFMPIHSVLDYMPADSLQTDQMTNCYGYLVTDKIIKLRDWLKDRVFGTNSWISTPDSCY